MDLINGNEIAQEIIEELKIEVSAIQGGKPCVVFIRVGEDPASVSYVSKKEKTAEKIGIESRLQLYPNSISQDELLEEISLANNNNEVHGILVQAPLPDHIDERTIFNHVSPSKDVDGFNAFNLGKLCQEQEDAFISCTPAGIIELIKRKNITTEGKHVVVLGRSLIVGKPAGMLFLRKGFPGNATVTFCHSRTPDLENHTRRADIIIAAIGKPQFVTKEMVKEGATIIDVGINRIEDSNKKSGFRLVGDVDFEQVAPQTKFITPVPGGVGPMTVAMLMKNTVQAFKGNHS
ncbi:MAG: bifunctional methylenetetrahydrofolate dehydrogenase/methenyltetrahydrofolate cyclohydrolase FolD [Opitutae bacterium]|jgi:methylenetetrahydrofolate dehydrogenase (NADP+)/methenyltetrahydrofolate cyclohydrolase|nr:bifunctional methylenetetrahydrofolate dehydrogenase/methenyltetrahydrofolate cyclohydrolase FolD [Opitutae bacterium]MBT7404872.1 bifunctional methylenetetrahydrofolate dehydrogenase/methenyltetrahydrofolate cyclohydrolase FolD [Opitutae bacterium]